MKDFSARDSLPRRTEIKIPIHHGDFFVLRHLKQFTQTYIPFIVQPGMRVADVGCGGQPLRQLIESCGGSYVGIDVTQNQAGTVEVVADISAIPIASESFDVIVCTEVLEHCWEPLQALQELSRLLKPTGTLLFTVPFAYPLHEAPYDFCRITPYFVSYWLPKLDLQSQILRVMGNELEVLATVWGHTWKPGKATPIVLRLLFAGMRLTFNLAVLSLRPLLRPFLKQNYFLNLGCVADKRVEPEVENS